MVGIQDFAYLNRKYFGGQLPPPALILYTNDADLAVQWPLSCIGHPNRPGKFAAYDGHPYIAILTDQSHDRQRLALLHEMCHEYIWRFRGDADPLHDDLDDVPVTWQDLTAYLVGSGESACVLAKHAAPPLATSQNLIKEGFDEQRENDGRLGDGPGAR